MGSSRSDFATLLRAWRDRLCPADAGFTATADRRAPGLRREELAQLAGLSVDYVLRLEQGRAKNPSAQVVGALARSLQLSRAERDQLYRSAGLLPPQDGTVGTHVPAGIQRLAGRLGDVPIGVFAADWTLVWWNAAWCALLGDPGLLPASERNLARALFGRGVAHAAMRPVVSERGPDAFEVAIVTDLKDAVFRYPRDVQLDRLVSELRGVSDSFAHHWSTQTAAVQHTSDRKTIRHPEVGDLLLDCDVLIVPGADLRMVTYTAAAGSSDAAKLDLLCVAGRRRVPGMVTATVREWHEEEGWGVLDCVETPGGCWGHFSDIEREGFRALSPGQQVELQWEAPGFEQDGYAYRAVRIVPRAGHSGSPGIAG